MVYQRSDTTPWSLWHTWHNGAAWQTPTQISDATQWPSLFRFGGGRSDIDASGRIWVTWAWASAQPSQVDGQTTGSITQMLSTSEDNGTTWKHSVLRKYVGAPNVWLPAYTHVRYIKELDQMHLFWMGDPANVAPPYPNGPRDLFHEEASMPNPHAPRQVVLTNVDVQDSDARGGVPPYAE